MPVALPGATSVAFRFSLGEEIDDVKGVGSADRVVLRLERPAWASLPGATSLPFSRPGLGEDGAGHGFVLATVVVEADVAVAKLLHRA